MSALGSGMAVAYVFLHLLPELEAEHRYLGSRVNLLVLVGFLVYYGLERLSSKPRRGADAETRAFRLVLLSYATYNCLLILGLPAKFLEQPAQMVLATFCIGVHLLHTDFELGSDHPERFDRWGHYVVAASPFLGCLLRSLLPEAQIERFEDALVALLAGSVMYTVFQSELGNSKESSFGGFLIGVLVYGSALLGLDHLSR